MEDKDQNIKNLIALNDEFVSLEEALEIINDNELLNFMENLNQMDITGKNCIIKVNSVKNKELISEDTEKNENEELLKFMDTLNEDGLISKNKRSKELIDSNKNEEFLLIEDLEKNENEELVNFINTLNEDGISKKKRLKKDLILKISKR
jgi:hypothetical protein